MRKISDQLGGSNSFDHLRLALALGVILHHSIALTRYGPYSWPAGYLALSGLFVPMFFAVSGFLVAASAERHTLPVFAAYRALRILPGLAVVILLGVFVAGPLITSLSLPAYFADRGTWLQFATLAGVQYTVLPGFHGFKITNFNGSLWTIPLEMACYYGLAWLAIIGAFRRRQILLAVAAAVVTFALWRGLADLSAKDSPHMVACFAVGTALYAYRDRIRTSLAAGLVALAIGVWLNYAGLARLSVVPLAYAAVAIGLSPARPLKADLSYGVYLSAFPVQQLLSLTDWGRIWQVNLVLSVAWALAYAALSWRFVEGPALALKPRARRWLEARGGILALLRNRLGGMPPAAAVQPASS